MKNTVIKLFMSLIMLFVSSSLFAAEPVSKSYFSSVAIGGMDTTAYHLPDVQKQHKAVMGALSLGEGLIKTDGTVWEFFGGNLHLFYAERGRQRWLNGDWEAYKVQADKAWAELK